MAPKNSQRLDYQGLAAALDQRGLIEATRLQVALTTSSQTKKPFPEVLIEDDLIGDWELSRVVCELYNLPFLPLDFCAPNPEALKLFDPQLLRAHRIVPLSRFGEVLTVAMPAIAPAEVLSTLAVAANVHVLPVVGTVVGNNRWINENLGGREAAAERAAAPLPARPTAAGPGKLPDLPSIGDISISMPELETLAGSLAEGDAEWSSIFDVGDAQVMQNLDNPSEGAAPPRRV
jgi:hypothetical protein